MLRGIIEMMLNVKNYIVHKSKNNKLVISVFLFSTIYIVIRIAINNITNGYKENSGSYFVEPALICPVILLFFSKRSFTKNLLFSFFFIFLLIASSEIFWGYMDKPWFSPPESYTCDGPCYGWFSFENDSPFFSIFLAGGISIIIGSLLKLLLGIKNAFSKPLHFNITSNKK